MKLVTPPLKVDEKDGFKNDILGREEYGKALSNLICNSSDELVIALDGQWGEGKTTFIKMWQGLLFQNGVHPIYIDAFATDFVDDAFISIVSAITNYFKDHIGKDNNTALKCFLGKVIQTGKVLAPRFLKNSIEKVTFGTVKSDDIEAAFHEPDSDIEARLIKHTDDLKTISEFKTLLSTMPEKLANNPSKPLVVIIDELDRCKPTYAVEFIEKIKHFFSVKNVVFVLAMNKEQLEAAIKCVYGANIDAHTYLQKFITINTQLPKDTTTEHNNDISKYINHLIKTHDIEFFGGKKNIICYVEALACHFNLSLRQLEKVFTHLAISYGSIQETYVTIAALTSFLACVKVIDPALFNQLQTGSISYDETCTVFNRSEPSEDSLNSQNGELCRIMKWLGVCLLPEKEGGTRKDINGDHLKKIADDSFWTKYSITPDQLIPLLAKRMNILSIT